MSNLQTLISQIPGWQEQLPVALFATLNQKTIQYVDPKQYRLVDIAKLIGDANMNAFLDAVRSAGYDWMITEAASGFVPGDDPINTRLRLLNHPLSIQIADHTNRLISPLEQANITTTPEEVAQVQALMLHEERKDKLRISGSTRWNRYSDAIDNLQPGDPDPDL